MARWWKSPWTAAIVGAFCYVGSLGHEFTIDDKPIIEKNPRIRDVTNFRGIWLTDWWYGGAEGDESLPDPMRDRLYRPLTMHTFALQYAMHGLAPLGYHAVNVLLHAAVCLLVWYFVNRLLRDETIAAISALLFAVHPVHVEAVTNVVGRAEVLVALFVLLGLLAILPRDRPPGTRRCVLAALAFLAAVFSKETAICYPLLVVAVLLHDRRAVLRPLAIALVPLLIYFPLRLTALEQQLIRPRLTNVVDNPLNDADLWGRIYGPFTVLGNYTRLTFAPNTLLCDYGYAVFDPYHPTTMTAVGLVAAVALMTLTVIWIRGIANRKNGATPLRDVALFAVLFLASYALISNALVLIGVALAERLFYWPSVPVLAGLAAGAVWAWRRLCAPGAALAGVSRVLPLLGVAVLGALGFRSLFRTLDWESDLRLFANDVAVNSNSAHLDLGLAEQLTKVGSEMQPGDERDKLLNRAEQLVDHTLQLAPNFPNAFRVKGMLLELRGDRSTADAYYARAVEFNPRDRTAQSRRAALREDAAARAAHCDELLRRIQEHPDDIAARLEVSELLLERGQPLEALHQLEDAYQRAPDDLDVLRRYGNALIVNLQDAQARTILLHVIARDPDDWQTHTNLITLFGESNPSAALHHAEEAARILPNDGRVQMNLAGALVLNRRYSEALDIYRRVRNALPPTDPRYPIVERAIQRIERGE